MRRVILVILEVIMVIVIVVICPPHQIPRCRSFSVTSFVSIESYVFMMHAGECGLSVASTFG